MVSVHDPCTDIDDSPCIDIAIRVDEQGIGYKKILIDTNIID
jgi:hypothetical protein